MIVQCVVATCVVLFCSTQVCCQTRVLDMKPDAFDDQYIGCEDEMEEEMSNILEEEIEINEWFNETWTAAEDLWDNHYSNLYESLQKEYGVALVLYTMVDPYPIYEQLNVEVSIAGKSRDHYLENFHFKALHFYLTRALQVLRKGCAQRFTTYRGSTLGNINVSPELRFGQFASSSLNENTAEQFGTDPFFIISTCFGVDIDEFSIDKEQEVLIPVAEKFRNIKRNGSTYILESTGQMCSYFNCAYLGEEKRETPECHSIHEVIETEEEMEDLDCSSEEKRETPECHSIHEDSVIETEEEMEDLDCSSEEKRETPECHSIHEDSVIETEEEMEDLDCSSEEKRETPECRPINEDSVIETEEEMEDLDCSSEEKRETPECHSIHEVIETEEEIEDLDCSSGTFLYSGSSARLFLVGLIMNIVISHLY